MLQFPLNIAQNKQEIRKFTKQIRKNLYLKGETDRISKLITQNIKNSEHYKNAKNVMLFHPLKEEINLLDLLYDKTKNFFFPKCSEKKLLICPDCGDFSLNKYGISEPASDAINDVSIIDIVFVPALCADLNCSRLGYGGGYYDRFFKDENLRAKKIIVISENFIAQKLPQDEYDIPCGLIISEKRTITRE